MKDKENEFVLFDDYNSKLSIELKDDYWYIVINEDIFDEFCCGVNTFIFKGNNNNQVIADLVAKLFNEIGKCSNVKDKL